MAGIRETLKQAVNDLKKGKSEKVPANTGYSVRLPNGGGIVSGQTLEEASNYTRMLYGRDEKVKLKK